MPPTPRTAPAFPDEISREWRQGLVTRQLDDLNVLGEALVVALNGKDDVQAATVCASLGRYAHAMGWSRDKFLPAIVAYANERPAFDEDLFAPAFILKSIAPDHSETAALLAKVPPDVRHLLARL
ncbi:MAG TPA: hypothetical protein VF524_07740 [Polyangia bacterium]